MFPFQAASTPPPAQRAPAADGSTLSATQAALHASILAALVLSTFEGPVRYALNALHLDALIFVRDAALCAALLAFIAARLRVNAVPLAVAVFGLLVLLHSFVSVVNLGTPIAAIYGLKVFLPALCGYLSWRSLFEPGPVLLRWVAVMWLALVISAGLEKFWLDYPWVGMNVELGGVNVFLGRDWQAGNVKRVAALTRSSINLAIVLPLLSGMLMMGLRSRVARMLVAIATLVVLVWTTQKGAILGYFLAMAAVSLSGRNLLAPLKLAIVGSTALMIFAPTVLIHFEMPSDQGVFSFESMIDRIEWMWPNAWHWINQFPPFLGVGLGGIGGGQRFFAPKAYNAADNLFVYLYGSFGLASLAYLAGLNWLALSARLTARSNDRLLLASLCFLLMYGLVISLIEDQIAALWFGACVGWLVERQPRTRQLPEVRCASPA